MDACFCNATAIQAYFNALLDEKSYSSSNKINSNQSFSDKDTEFVLNETSSSHQSTFIKKIAICVSQNWFEIGMTCMRTICSYIDCMTETRTYDGLPDSLVNSEQVHGYFRFA